MTAERDNSAAESYLYLNLICAMDAASSLNADRLWGQAGGSIANVVLNHARVSRRVASSASGSSASVSCASHPAIPPRPWPNRLKRPQNSFALLQDAWISLMGSNLPCTSEVLCRQQTPQIPCGSSATNKKFAI